MTDEPRTALPMTDVFATISGVKVPDGKGYAVEFKVTVPLTKEDSLADFLHIIRARRAGGARITLRLEQEPLPEPPPPMDGEIPADPFPAWERMFEASEMPLCECPPNDDPSLTDYPNAIFDTTAEGTTVTIEHIDPCKLDNAKISSMDFTETEDFNRAIVKARGLKPVPLAEEEDDDSDSERGET